MEIGLYTFADVAAGQPDLAGQRLRNLVEEMELADQVGLDVFAVGEHHRDLGGLRCLDRHSRRGGTRGDVDDRIHPSRD